MAESVEIHIFSFISNDRMDSGMHGDWDTYDMETHCLISGGSYWLPKPS